MATSLLTRIPQPEPRITRMVLIVHLIRGLPVGQWESPIVRQFEERFQPFYLGDDLFGVHAVSPNA